MWPGSIQTHGVSAVQSCVLFVSFFEAGNRGAKPTFRKWYRTYQPESTMQISWISLIICNLITIREQLHGIYFNMEDNRTILTRYISSILLKKKKKKKVDDIHEISRFR